MKKALAIISFGTSYETGEKGIKAIEESLAKQFPEYDCFRAFTSNMIIKKLKREENIHIKTTKELLAYLKEEGYEEVICQPTHMIHGVEFDKMMGQIQEFKGQFQVLKVGYPLLHELDDYKKCVELYETSGILEQGDAVVLMGHGSDHFAGSAYSQMEKMFQVMGHNNVYMGTVEGFPTFEDVKEELSKKEYKRLVISPFMIVAGDHAYNDLIGEEEDSWQNQLMSLGYQTVPAMKGLGEYEEIAMIYGEHIRKAVTVK